MSSPFGSTYTNELLRRCAERRTCTATTVVLAALGTAVDAGLIELGDLLDLVRSCSTPAQLGDALTMLAATVPAGDQQVPEGGAQWTR